MSTIFIKNGLFRYLMPLFHMVLVPVASGKPLNSRSADTWKIGCTGRRSIEIFYSRVQDCMRGLQAHEYRVHAGR